MGVAPGKSGRGAAGLAVHCGELQASGVTRVALATPPIETWYCNPVPIITQESGKTSPTRFTGN